MIKWSNWKEEEEQRGIYNKTMLLSYFCALDGFPAASLIKYASGKEMMYRCDAVCTHIFFPLFCSCHSPFHVLGLLLMSFYLLVSPTQIAKFSLLFFTTSFHPYTLPLPQPPPRHFPHLPPPQHPTPPPPLPTSCHTPSNLS